MQEDQVIESNLNTEFQQKGLEKEHVDTRPQHVGSEIWIYSYLELEQHTTKHLRTSQGVGGKEYARKTFQFMNWINC